MVNALVAIGANLPSAAGTARETCVAAVAALADRGLAVVRRSRWFESPPDPPSDQPWYVNGVAAVTTDLSPEALLAVLQAIESGFGRVRGARNAARTLDLDLIDYDGLVRPGPEAPVLPHPRMDRRAFVLYPMADIAPIWRHPRSGIALTDLIKALPPGTTCRPIVESGQKSP